MTKPTERAAERLPAASRATSTARYLPAGRRRLPIRPLNDTELPPGLDARASVPRATRRVQRLARRSARVGLRQSLPLRRPASLRLIAMFTAAGSLKV